MKGKFSWKRNGNSGRSGDSPFIVAVNCDNRITFIAELAIQANNPLLVFLNHRTCIATENNNKSLCIFKLQKRNHLPIHILKADIRNKISNQRR